jgi:hypothetical protein
MLVAVAVAGNINVNVPLHSVHVHGQITGRSRARPIVHDHVYAWPCTSASAFRVDVHGGPST